MKFRSKHAVLSLVIATALGGMVVADASAQTTRSSGRSSKNSDKPEVRYPDATRADVRQRTEVKIADIEAKITDLQRMKAALVKLAASCRGHGSVSDCPILEALGQPPADSMNGRQRPVR